MKFAPSYLKEIYGVAFYISEVFIYRGAFHYLRKSVQERKRFKKNVCKEEQI